MTTKQRPPIPFEVVAWLLLGGNLTCVLLGYIIGTLLELDWLAVMLLSAAALLSCREAILRSRWYRR